jgi:hypothetical protein
MRIHPAVSSNIAYGKRLVGSGIEGASSAGRQILEEEPIGEVLSRAAKESWKPAVIGACAGMAAAIWKRDRDPAKGAVLGGLVGAALGFSGGILWGSRNVTGALVRGAAKSVGAARDERWLERNPIDYA